MFGTGNHCGIENHEKIPPFISEQPLKLGPRIETRAKIGHCGKVLGASGNWVGGMCGATGGPPAKKLAGSLREWEWRDKGGGAGHFASHFASESLGASHFASHFASESLGASHFASHSASTPVFASHFASVFASHFSAGFWAKKGGHSVPTAILGRGPPGTSQVPAKQLQGGGGGLASPAKSQNPCFTKIVARAVWHSANLTV